MRQTELIATLTEPPVDDGAALRALGPDVAYLEVRADLVGDLDPDWLRDRFPGGLVYTLRSRSEGGVFDGGRKARQARIVREAPRYDLVDLEASRDCRPDVLDHVPASQRVISWHGKSAHLRALQQRFANQSRHEARYYKMIPTASQPGDALVVLGLLQSLARNDVIAFSGGPLGTWTRLLAPYLGSPLTYGALGDVPGAPGQMSIEQLRRDHGLPSLPPIERLYGIVGSPVSHSLSPRLHNGAYRALGIPARYLPFETPSFADFWLEVVETPGLEALGMPLHGLSVTSPFKAVALAVSGASSPRAQHIGAANTLVLNNGVWEAETTDPEGVTESLRHDDVTLAGARTVVVGCGGAGKAAAYGLRLAGADVTLVNRTAERAQTAALELGLPFVTLDAFNRGDCERAGVDIVVHATSLGHRQDDPLPFALETLGADTVIIDLVYDHATTPLIRAARTAGLRAFEGRSALLFQALGQFQRFTGRTLDEALARDLLGLGDTPSTAREERIR